MINNIRLREITEQDQVFLLAVYSSTREAELAQTGWSVQEQSDFLQSQFNAQHQHYQQHYSEASFDLVLVDDKPVGRLYVARWPSQIRIVDIALLTEFRGKKIGTELISALFTEAKEKQLELSIHVEKNNPAMGWYQGLGFLEIEDKGIYSLMRTHMLSQETA
ncbi:MAG: GNAT family N-acetyltransferase [Methylococcales bacterium]